MKRVFIFIFFCYCIFFFLIPPLQTPDEGGHYETVYWVSGDIYPTIYTNFKTNPHPYGTDLAALFPIGIGHPMQIPNFKKIKQSNLQIQQHYSVKQTKQFIPESAQAYNPPIYYIVGAFFLKLSQFLKQSLLTQFYFTRLASTLFYFGTIYFGYKTLQLLFQKEKIAKSILLFFALNPLLLKSGVGVNPDIAITFFTTFFVFMSCFFIKKKILFTTKSVVILGLIAGLATLTKLSGIFLVAGLLLFFIFQTIKIKQKIIAGVTFLATFLLTQIPWILFNIIHYHKILVEDIALGPTSKTLATSIPEAIISAIFEFRHTFFHFAGFLGWNDVYPFPFIFISYAVLFVLFLGIGIYLACKSKNNYFHYMLSLLACLFLFFYGLSLHHKLFYPGWDIQGRYVLPGFFMMSVFSIYGATKLFRKTFEQLVPYFSYFAIFYYFFIVVFVLLPRYYV